MERNKKKSTGIIGKLGFFIFQAGENSGDLLTNSRRTETTMSDEHYGPETDPVLKKLLEEFKQGLDDWRKKEKVRIINPHKYAQFRNSLIDFTRLIRDRNPDATISYRLNDALDGGQASISATFYAVDIRDIATFVEVIKDSFSIEFCGCYEKDKVCLEISYKGLYEDLFTGESTN